MRPGKPPDKILSNYRASRNLPFTQPGDAKNTGEPRHQVRPDNSVLSDVIIMELSHLLGLSRPAVGSGQWAVATFKFKLKKLGQLGPERKLGLEDRKSWLN